MYTALYRTRFFCAQRQRVLYVVVLGHSQVVGRWAERSAARHAATIHRVVSRAGRHRSRQRPRHRTVTAAAEHGMTRPHEPAGIMLVAAAERRLYAAAKVAATEAVVVFNSGLEVHGLFDGAEYHFADFFASVRAVSGAAAKAAAKAATRRFRGFATRPVVRGAEIAPPRLCNTRARTSVSAAGPAAPVPVRFGRKEVAQLHCTIAATASKTVAEVCAMIAGFCSRVYVLFGTVAAFILEGSYNIVSLFISY